MRGEVVSNRLTSLFHFAMVLIEAPPRSSPEETLSQALRKLIRGKDHAVWRPFLDKLVFFWVAEPRKVWDYRSQKGWFESHSVPYLFFPHVAEARDWVERVAFSQPQGGYLLWSVVVDVYLPETWVHRNGRKLKKGIYPPYQLPHGWTPESLQDVFRQIQFFRPWKNLKINLLQTDVALEIAAL